MINAIFDESTEEEDICDADSYYKKSYENKEDLELNDSSN